MLDKVLIAELLQELSVKDAPLTTVAAGAYAAAHVQKFQDAIKSIGTKQMTDMGSSFIKGKAAHRRCIWTEAFKRLACEHFGVEDFDSFFTPDGRRGQQFARELHRQRARQFELDKKAPKAAKELANRIHQVYKIADLYGAELTPIRGAMRVSVPTKQGPIVFTLGKKGVQKKLREAETLES